MSKGQELEAELKRLAAHNACKMRGNAKKTRWQLGRDVRAIEVSLKRRLTMAELKLPFNEWYRLSRPFLDGAETPEDQFVGFLAERQKVRVPTGEGDTINKAVDRVKRFSVSELPVIPGYADAPENCRRVAAVHREISRLTSGNTYFLSCRDAARAVPGLSHQTAHNINRVLEELGVIKMVSVGDAHPNGRASKFRYLLSQSENGAEEDDGGLEI